MKKFKCNNTSKSFKIMKKIILVINRKSSSTSTELLKKKIYIVRNERKILKPNNNIWKYKFLLKNEENWETH